MQSAIVLLYNHVFRVCLYYIFPHHIINDTIFIKEIYKRNLYSLILNRIRLEIFLKKNFRKFLSYIFVYKQLSIILSRNQQNTNHFNFVPIFL